MADTFLTGEGRMNQALAMSVAFTAAASGVLHDTIQSSKNCWNVPTKSAVRQGSQSFIENVQHALFGSDRSSVPLARARSFEEVAEFYKKQSQPEMSLQLYRYAIDLREHILGEADPQLVVDLRTASELSEELGDPKEANELLQQAIEVCKRHASDRD
jgi:tetratricopeptide (TPR) repeat protein